MNAGRLRLLFIVYYFPPCGGAAGLRALHWASYLPEHGVDVTVLAPENAVYPLEDDSLLARLPDSVCVERVRSFLPGASTAMRRVRGGTFSEGGVSHDSTLRKLLRGIRDNVFIPDECVGFARSAAKAAERLHAGGSFDAMLTLSQPASVHFAGQRARSRTGLPWIAELDDPWTENWCDVDRAPMRRWLEPGMERSVLTGCDLAVATADTLRDRWRARFPGMPASHFESVRVGYNESEFASAPPARSDRWTLAYVGGLYSHRSAAFFLDALGRYVAANPQERELMRMAFLGGKDEFNKRDFQQSVERNKLSGVVEDLGFRSHDEALALLKGSDALLYLGGEPPEGDLMVQCKVYEYLRACKPVLAMSREVESLRILRGGPALLRVDRTDVAGAARAIAELRRMPANDPSPGLQAAAPYEVRALAGQMADLVRRVAAGTRRGP